MKVIRKIIPLKLRIWVGPYLNFVVYINNVYFRKNRQRPHVLSLNETLDLISKKNISAIRFGDGEMSLIRSENLGFQKSNPVLSKKLEEIIQVNNPDLLICIPGIWENINHFSRGSFWFTIHHLFKHGKSWKSILNLDQTYGDAFITRPYLVFKDRKHSDKIFKKMKEIWFKKSIVLIEGSGTRLGVQNDLFQDVRSIKRILCPSENAFDKYEQIKDEAFKIDKKELILISLGPTAKVLAYELFMAGYRVIDIGHIDMEYEMFLRNSHEIVKIPYKYFNEIGERKPEDCTDTDYLKQIIARIE